MKYPTKRGQKLIPEIYMELSLVFENDFDVNHITQLLGILPDDCKRMGETRINPITQKHNPGYWTLKTETFYDYDIDKAVQAMITKIKEHLLQIRTICIENDGEAIFDIVPSFDPSNKPAIYFNRDFLDIVDYLNATIDIDMYVLSDDEKTINIT